MNDRAIHHVNNGQHQQSQGIRVQQSPSPTTTTGSPVTGHPAPATPPLPSAMPTSRVPDASYMALFGKEYDRLLYQRQISAWRLSIEKKRSELCAGLKVDETRLELYASSNMSLVPGKNSPARPRPGYSPPRCPGRISRPGYSPSRCPGRITLS